MPPPPHLQQKFTREGPSHTESQIIGVELAMRDGTNREIELDMFSAKHTVPYDYRMIPRVRITLHTSDGDITSEFPYRPGNTFRSY